MIAFTRPRSTAAKCEKTRCGGKSLQNVRSCAIAFPNVRSALHSIFFGCNLSPSLFSSAVSTIQRFSRSTLCTRSPHNGSFHWCPIAKFNLKMKEISARLVLSDCTFVSQIVIIIYRTYWSSSIECVLCMPVHRVLLNSVIIFVVCFFFFFLLSSFLCCDLICFVPGTDHDRRRRCYLRFLFIFHINLATLIAYYNDTRQHESVFFLSLPPLLRYFKTSKLLRKLFTIITAQRTHILNPN